MNSKSYLIKINIYLFKFLSNIYHNQKYSTIVDNHIKQISLYNIENFPSYWFEAMSYADEYKNLQYFPQTYEMVFFHGEKLLEQYLNKIEDEEKLLIITNKLLEILFFIISEFNFKNEVKDIFNMIKVSENYGFIFDEKNKLLLNSLIKNNLEQIKIQSFTKLIYKYQMQLTYFEKVGTFKEICIQVHSILEKAKSDSKENKEIHTLILKYFTKENINKWQRECNHFRHSETDSSTDKDYMSDFYSFDDKEKIIFMNERIQVYIFIISILRINNLLSDSNLSFKIYENKIITKDK